MRPQGVEVIDGKVRYDGRTLAGWAPVLAERIYQRCRAERIVLFGSVARGDDGPDSDIDLLVVLPRVQHRHDAAVAVLRELRDLPAPVDVVVIDSAGFQRERHVPGIVRVAMREGQPAEATRDEAEKALSIAREVLNIVRPQLKR